MARWLPRRFGPRRAGPNRVGCQGRDRGSDGIRTRTCELPAPPHHKPDGLLFPAHYPVWAALPSTMRRERPATPKQQRPHIHPADWPTIAERARFESLRDLAVEYDVSHETIRAVVRRAAEQRHQA